MKNALFPTVEAVRYGPDAPVQIFQWEPEFTELLTLYREIQPKRVLEVGTYFGGTLYHWLQWARPGTLVVSVDSYTVNVDNRELYRSWCNEGVTVKAIAGDSRAPETIAEAAEWGPYDWLFIDAGHYYGEVEADWKNYVPLCDPGAIVALHDILPPSAAHPEIEVDRLWREIQRAGYVTREIVVNPDADWGGIGVVYLP